MYENEKGQSHWTEICTSNNSWSVSNKRIIIKEEVSMSAQGEIKHFDHWIRRRSRKKSTSSGKILRLHHVPMLSFYEKSYLLSTPTHYSHFHFDNQMKTWMTITWIYSFRSSYFVFSSCFHSSKMFSVMYSRSLCMFTQVYPITSDFEQILVHSHCIWKNLDLLMWSVIGALHTKNVLRYLYSSRVLWTRIADALDIWGRTSIVNWI